MAKTQPPTDEDGNELPPLGKVPHLPPRPVPVFPHEKKSGGKKS